MLARYASTVAHHFSCKLKMSKNGGRGVARNAPTLIFNFQFSETQRILHPQALVWLAALLELSLLKYKIWALEAEDE